MKLSVEAKVAASVAAGFLALTVGAMTQGNSGGQSAAPNEYAPMHSPAVNTYLSQHGYDSSLASRAYAEDNRLRPQ